MTLHFLPQTSHNPPSVTTEKRKTNPLSTVPAETITKLQTDALTLQRSRKSRVFIRVT